MENERLASVQPNCFLKFFAFVRFLLVRWFKLKKIFGLYLSNLTKI